MTDKNNGLSLPVNKPSGQNRTHDKSSAICPSRTGSGYYYHIWDIKPDFVVSFLKRSFLQELPMLTGKIPTLANEKPLRYSCSCGRSPLIQEFDVEIILFHSKTCHTSFTPLFVTEPNSLDVTVHPSLPS